MKLLSIISITLLGECFTQADNHLTRIKDRGLRGLLDDDIQIESRIVGGTDVPVEEYPFFVQWNGCGGSLIASDLVLTAAHCNVIQSQNIRVGSSRKTGSIGRGSFRRISERVLHPMYNPDGVNYDYMILKLSQPLDDNFPPIKLNEDNLVPADKETLTVLGFGNTSEQGNKTVVLQQVDVNYIPETQCNQGRSYDGEVKDLTMFCAAGLGKDSCQGDSGGPIFRKSGEEFEQVGLVSWGRGCSRQEFPGVYARVSGQIEWIKKEICHLSDFKPDYCESYGNSENGEVNIRLDITYDQYVNEVTWSFNQNGHTPLYKVANEGNDSLHGIYELTLDPGPATFVITDSFSDGICCKFGNGGYRIYAELSGGDELLAESDGQYGSWQIQNLIIPEIQSPPPSTKFPSVSPSFRPTSPPTLTPTFLQTSSPTKNPTEQPTSSRSSTSTCRDYNDVTFDVDGDILGKNCLWLERNWSRYDYLCRFVDVASACRSLCTACRYFESN